MPPSRTPAAPPEPATAPQTPSALLRSAPSANVVVTIDSAAGETSAAPRPCTRAGDDQPDLALGEAAGQRGEREEDEAGDEQAAAAEQVGEAAAEQQEAAEDQGVGVDDPREVVLGEVEVLADRRQRDVDDRRVEDDDELGGGQQRERQPLVVAGERRWTRGDLLGCRESGGVVPVAFETIRRSGSVCQAARYSADHELHGAASPQRADARRNRERIVEAARELFAECGQATQMDDVARRAQVGVGTVYRHFPTKGALQGELMAAKFRHHAEVARRWAAQSPTAGRRSRASCARSFAAMATDASLRQRVTWSEDAEALALAEPERQALSVVVGEIIERAQAQGRMTPDFTVADMPALMCSAGAVITAQQASPVVLGDRFLDLLIDALRVCPQRA